MRHSDVDVKKIYFQYLCDIVAKSHKKYSNLLYCLYDRAFDWEYELDLNRAFDGLDMRRSFELHTGHNRALLTGPCNMLEMMVALSIKMENTMVDLSKGDRTGQWFWTMVHSLGLASMTDSNFDENYVDDVLNQFMRHEYGRDGKGGLFTIPDTEYDMRDEEIHTQMCWYLNTLEE